MSRKAGRNSLFLIGHTEDDIRGSKLPSNLQVLQYLFHRLRDQREDLFDSYKATAEKLVGFWNKARIPTRKKCRVLDKISSLYEQFRAIQKNCSRRSASQIKKEDDFKSNFDDLFDISHGNALDIILN